MLVEGLSILATPDDHLGACLRKVMPASNLQAFKADSVWLGPQQAKFVKVCARDSIVHRSLRHCVNNLHGNRCNAMNRDKTFCLIILEI